MRPAPFFFLDMEGHGMKDRTAQPGARARAAYMDIVEDAPEAVAIPGTRRSVRVRGIKPYTLERLTRLWVERDLAQGPPEGADATLRSMCSEPYFAVKEAALMVLNGYWAIRLWWPVLWRWWAYVRGYTESQMTPVIAAGKKKLQLTAHWMNMAYSTDMRTDWMAMTRRESERYRAELLSAASRPSSRSSLSTGGRGASSSVRSPSATGATGAS